MQNIDWHNIDIKELRALKRELREKRVSGFLERYPDTKFKEAARALEVEKNLVKGRPVIYGEGDSWFDFPWIVLLNRCSDILDVLLFEHKYTVFRDSKRGDTLNNMQSPSNMCHLRERCNALSPQAFLLSGGGNDLFSFSIDGDVTSSVFHAVINPASSPETIDRDAWERELLLMQGPQVSG